MKHISRILIVYLSIFISFKGQCQVTLVKDINRLTGSSYPQSFKQCDEYLYFVAYTNENGYELWRTDGKESGTDIFKEFGPGYIYGYPICLAYDNGNMFIRAANEINGYELWISDGTDEGTNMVEDIYPGGSTGFRSLLEKVIFHNGILYFIANDGIHGNELWKSDGTAEGTIMIKDINPGQDNGLDASSDGGGIVVLNDILYFEADNGTNGNELWKSDGTNEGTVMVKDIKEGSGSSLGLSRYNRIVIMDNILYFEALNELWKSDGTETGTVMVKDIWPGYRSSDPSSLISINNTLYFVANTEDYGLELWKSDGTETGTVMVKNIRPAGSSSPSSLININNTLYFNARSEDYGRELWKSDGTETGTVMVKDIYLGSESGIKSEFYDGKVNFFEVNGELFFSASDGTNGYELWKSDGTDTGTVKVKNINPLFWRYDFWVSYSSYNDALYFTVDDTINGNELWRSDGTESGTFMLKDICPGTASSFPSELTSINGTIYFVSDDGIHDKELWKSDGTESGTVMVKDLSTGYSSSPPSYLTVMNDELFFMAYKIGYGTELWKSDGTDTGTVLVKDIYPGPISGSPSYLANINDVLFFWANDGIHGSELWKSDGTDSGTVIVKDINAGEGSGYDNVVNNQFNKIVNLGGLSFFTANNGLNGYELWESDGTEQGTVMVKDINQGINSSTPSNFTAVSDILFFTANDGINGLELWKSDGTEEGTTILKDICEGIGSCEIENLTAVDGLLYFTANDSINGLELWRSDGTENGTYMVKDIYPGSGSGISSCFVIEIPELNYFNIAEFNGEIYFPATDGIHGKELWKSDGTDTGTVLVKDIMPGINSSNPRNLFSVGGKLFFVATDINGIENLWEFDGTENSIQKISSKNYVIPPTPYFTLNNNDLFFVGSIDDSGYELLKYSSIITNDNPPLYSEKKILVYPNPSSGIVNIDCRIEEYPMTFLLNDLSGKKIFEKEITSGSTSINLSWVKSGIYIYQCKIGKSNYSGKIILY